MRTVSVVLGLLVVPVPALPAQQQAQHDLGAVRFEVSCDAAVRPAFDRAVALLHHMMYDEARQAFTEIAERAPACGMAHWGIAMTLFQPLWPTRPGPEALARGRELVARAQAHAPASPRERDLIAAAAAFFDDPATDYWTRIERWAAAMERAYGARPDDVETAVFYALSRLAVAPRGNARMAEHARAADVLLRMHERVPHHPGATHYTIHANDVDGRAGEALDVVRGYDDIAPSVPHALHMPTHILVRLGEWPGVIEWNRKSADAALASAAAGDLSLHYVHAMDYLVYAELQRGADARARELVDEAFGKGPHPENFASAFHLASMPARLAVERRAWAAATGLTPRAPDYLAWDRYVWPEAITWFAKGLGAARTGDVPGAREALERMRALEQRAEEQGERNFARYIETDRHVLQGWIAHAEGDAAAAVRHMELGADVEASVQKHPVTPGALYPPYEALGDLLRALDRPADALRAYERGLTTWPNRFHSLLGAARAAREAGETQKARTYYAELLDVVGDAASARESVEEARAFRR